ncbi:histone-fold-containing protein [Polychaeton citri CBS 116435]|uniref:DNA polymerase epsilon subunit D n=1 Tax=Polychaeton citri CBS 116435 TaxID=1314669 RepID=A0A9P4PZ11_9PEZI|nr:histone-fold-containing protein [Polychaeton citri CBS 116435]
MAPRKSNVSTVSNADQEPPVSPPSKSHRDSIGIEDLTLPKSIIGRLAKGILPANTNIGKDALLAMHKSATVFVSYIAAAANENAQGSGKKTIMPPDVFQALKDSDLGDFLPRLEAELKKYNETQCDKRNNYRRRVKEEKAAAVATDEGTDETLQDVSTMSNGINGMANGHQNGDERPAKKMRGQNGTVVPGEDDTDMDDSFDVDGKQDDEDANSDDEDEGVDEDDEDDAEDGEDQDQTLEDRIEDDRGRSDDDDDDDDDEALDDDDDSD